MSCQTVRLKERSAGSHDVADAKVVRFAGWLLVAVLPCIFQGLARMLPTRLPFLSESAARDV